MSDADSVPGLIWQAADLLRGSHRAWEYGNVLLPLTLLRRLDAALTPESAQAGGATHNSSGLDFKHLKADPRAIDQNLLAYIEGFPENIRQIFAGFDFSREIKRLHQARILYQIISRFADIDLNPAVVSGYQMEIIFENLISRCGELSGDIMADHFTPRDVIRLMVNLLFSSDDQLRGASGATRRLLDPACGTGGMLTESRRYLHEGLASGELRVYGQDINPWSFAIASASMLIAEADLPGSVGEVRLGNAFTEDRFPEEMFDYFLCHPPFGVEWKSVRDFIVAEAERDHMGRFGAGLPRINDGSLLFLQHMWSKRAAVAGSKGGSRLVIVFNGSPMFTGGAGSGESEIRKWIIENDWLEAIIALPESLFPHTSIGTFLWLLTNRKEVRRQGKVQLIDARDIVAPSDANSRRDFGTKRKYLGNREIEEIACLYRRFTPEKRSKIVYNMDLGYRRITIEYPLRLRYTMTASRKERFLDVYPELLDDVQAIDKVLGREPRLDWTETKRQIEGVLASRNRRWPPQEFKTFRVVFTQRDPAGVPVRREGREREFEPDLDRREYDEVPLGTDVGEYFAREYARYDPTAWLADSPPAVGYQIPFNRYFYEFTPLRSLTEIDRDLAEAEEEFHRLWEAR